MIIIKLDQTADVTRRVRFTCPKHKEKCVRYVHNNNSYGIETMTLIKPSEEIHKTPKTLCS